MNNALIAIQKNICCYYDDENNIFEITHRELKHLLNMINVSYILLVTCF